MCFKYMLLSLVRILLAMKRLLLFCVAACYGFTLQAQLLTWTPAFPKEGVHQIEIKGLFIPDGLYYIKQQTKTVPVTIQ